MRKILLIDSDRTGHGQFLTMAEAAGYQVSTSTDFEHATDILKSECIDVVFTSLQVSAKSSFLLKKQYEEIILPRKISCERTHWVFVSKDLDVLEVENAVKKGATYFIKKPYHSIDFEIVLKKIKEKIGNPILEMKHVVTALTGVRFDDSKLLLIETRINRRLRELKLKDLDDYLKFFDQNRPQELEHIVSALTTHTTKFFREEEHFDFLFNNVFPKIILGRKGIKVWSAACSSGEELYSLVICFLEFCRENKVNVNKLKGLQFLGTDVDTQSIKKAESGVFRKKYLKSIPQHIRDYYFDEMEIDGHQYLHIKSFVKSLCCFKINNLQNKHYETDGEFDIIFIRNVFIYFESHNIEQISQRLIKSLGPEGHLFLGHSESLREFNTDLKLAAPAVYKHHESSHGKGLMTNSKNSRIRSHKSKKIRVLIVDDSLTIRKVLNKIISLDDQLEVVGEVCNPLEAIDFLKSNSIDVMTLDIHMPKLDGISYLSRCDNNHPPVVMISSASEQEAKKIFELKSNLVLDYIQKPSKHDMKDVSEHIISSLKASIKSKLPISKIRKKRDEHKMSIASSSDLILIGASTGGISAIENILLNSRIDSPPILIVQHFPKGFSRAFAERLNRICEIRVSEAVEGEVIEKGRAYIAPGGKHMTFNKKLKKFVININDDDKINRFKPSVDALFYSVEKYANSLDVIAILLTGMGTDGARGLAALNHLGAITIAESESSCVVFGMPKKAIELGGVDHILSYKEIGTALAPITASM